MEELSFEEALAELEKVVHALEKGEVSLEESMKLFETGVALSRICNKRLDSAEAKIQVLLEKNGEIVAEAFQVEQED